MKLIKTNEHYALCLNNCLFSFVLFLYLFLFFFQHFLLKKNIEYAKVNIKKKKKKKKKKLF